MELSEVQQLLRAALHPNSWIPACCIVCQRDVLNRTCLCLACLESLPFMDESCRLCGIELPRSAGITCGGCLVQAPVFSFCRGLFHYRPPIDKLLLGFKFHAQFSTGQALSSLLAEEMKRYYMDKEKPELLIPVPLHSNRLRERGFNQALEIAKVIARKNSIPIANSILKKNRETQTQLILRSAKARKENLKHAFSLQRKQKKKEQLNSINSVALIDDVVTTMSTVSAISTLLKQHGIQRIDVWCLARASL